MAQHTVLGTCHHDCPDSCGWVATVEGEGATAQVVKLRGNPDHPYSQGELCPKVNRYVDRVHNPDRILTPLIRTGAKGVGEFRQASWDEAIELVVSRVNEEREAHGGETIWPWWSAGTQGMIQQSSVDKALFAKLGSSRMVDSVCGVAAGVGAAATYGGAGLGAGPLALVDAQLVILWGTNTRLTNRHLWPFVEQARAKGATIVCIDPMRTMTADSCDWFIQPLPGTDVAIMLAMMRVIIAEGFVDQDYVADHAEGFDELAAHVADWTPARAAAVSGVSEDEILRLARAYGEAKPAFIRALIGAEHHENGGMFYRTAACLPVLTGSWRHPAGGFSRSVGSWTDQATVDFSVYDAGHLASGPRRSFSQNHMGRTLTDTAADDQALNPPVNVLFVWNGNPVCTIPNSGLTRQGLAREDLFTVVSEQFMTDTARYADVIFPAASQLEQLDVVPSWGHLWLGWNAPATEPLGESVPNTELWRRLAAGFGFTEPEFQRTDRELVEMALCDVDLVELETRGFVRTNETADLMPYVNGGFATPSGKALLANPALVTQGLPAVPDFVPPGESPAGNPELAAKYPLMLTSPKVHTRFMNSSYSALAGHGDREGGPWVELDPVDAAARGLAADDEALVTNDRGTLRLPVRISDRLRPGLVAVPWGWWAEQHPDGLSINHLTNDTIGDFGVGVGYGDTLVEVSKA